MEPDHIEIEEGEISSDSTDYTPLERPANYSVVQPHTRFPVNQPSESEEELQSSDSDSDSDPNVRRNKKPKIKLKPKPQEQKRKKYDIWSTRVQEDVLSETLKSCDVTTKDRSRDVESYDYTLGRKYYAECEKVNNKRTRDDRKNVNFSVKHRRRSHSSEKSKKGKIRHILDLTVDLNSSSDDIAKDMANKLCEEKEDLLLRVINTMGKQKAIEIFKETKRIEEEGGMLIMNQTRRRTPGGVFLYLVRQDYHITPEQKEKIFGDEKQKSKVNAKAKQKQKSLEWKSQIAASKSKILPDLLTRAELLACQNPRRKIKDETEETDVINPPPTPETDGHENSVDIDILPLGMVNGNDSLDCPRGKITTYDEDFLDINCSNDMDQF